MKNDSIVQFRYSYPYEGTLLRLIGKNTTREDHKEGYEKTDSCQKVWNKYENKILKLFEEIYKIKVVEKTIKIYISFVLPNSFSDPLTITLKGLDIEKDEKSQRIFVYKIIHELGHYFMYTKDKKEFANILSDQVQEKNILGSHGANLHYLIQAVEFGIIGEVFGDKYANFRREFLIENYVGDEYGKSAKRLMDDKVPMDKSCLEFIDKNIL